nr:type VI immunity family protein [uncultured Flavobacterium sp.]
MLGPYNAFLARFKNDVKFSVLDGDQARPKKIMPAHFESLPAEMQNFKRRKSGGIVALFNNGSTIKEQCTPSFDQEYSKVKRPHSTVRINLPLSWYSENGLQGLEQLLQESLASYALTSGYIGYGFSWTDYYEYQVAYRFSQWLQNHPGFMHPSLAHRIASYYGLPDIGWITLLGLDFVEKMGGESNLKKSLDSIPQVNLHNYPNGTIGIRLGDAPRIGDVQNGDTMEEYQALGKILAPLRDTEPMTKNVSVDGLSYQPGYPFTSHLPHNARQLWLNRFFPEGKRIYENDKQ